MIKYAAHAWSRSKASAIDLQCMHGLIYVRFDCAICAVYVRMQDNKAKLQLQYVYKY
jgi:hypothetical protein